jgi:regulatory protein
VTEPATAAAPSKLLRAAIALLSRRDFSRAELRSRLLRAAGAQADQGEVERALDAAQAQGLLSEDRLIEGFIRTRQARFGPARLRYELSRRGISEDRIDAALSLAACDEYAVAHALWVKRFKSYSSDDAREQARQARFLASRGFSHDVIRRVLKAAR